VNTKRATAEQVPAVKKRTIIENYSPFYLTEPLANNCQKNDCFVRSRTTKGWLRAGYENIAKWKGGLANR
jgi:hypothetical protein